MNGSKKTHVGPVKEIQAPRPRHNSSLELFGEDAKTQEDTLQLILRHIDGAAEETRSTLGKFKDEIRNELDEHDRQLGEHNGKLVVLHERAEQTTRLEAKVTLMLSKVDLAIAQNERQDQQLLLLQTAREEGSRAGSSAGKKSGIWTGFSGGGILLIIVEVLRELFFRR